LAKKIQAEIQASPTTEVTHDPIAGEIVAVLIDSPIVGPVWFAFHDSFNSGDHIPVFFASELSSLRKMSTDELRRRYEQKRIFGGGWIWDRKGKLTYGWRRKNHPRITR
jgi:hypothetical protein